MENGKIAETNRLFQSDLDRQRLLNQLVYYSYGKSSSPKLISNFSVPYIVCLAVIVTSVIIKR